MRIYSRQGSPHIVLTQQFDGLFNIVVDNPIMGNSAVDRLANASYQITPGSPLKAPATESDSPHTGERRGFDTMT